MTRFCKELSAMRAIQQYKFNKNGNKAHYDDMSMDELIAGFNQEIGEFVVALLTGESIDIALEAADINNYTTLISAKLGGLWEFGLKEVQKEWKDLGSVSEVEMWVNEPGLSPGSYGGTEAEDDPRKVPE